MNLLFGTKNLCRSKEDPYTQAYSEYSSDINGGYKVKSSSPKKKLNLFGIFKKRQPLKSLDNNCNLKNRTYCYTPQKPSAPVLNKEDWRKEIGIPAQKFMEIIYENSIKTLPKKQSFNKFIHWEVFGEKIWTHKQSLKNTANSPIEGFKMTMDIARNALNLKKWACSNNHTKVLFINVLKLSGLTESEIRKLFVKAVYRAKTS